MYDTTGRRYLDGSGGPAAFGIGHENPEVNATIASHRAGRRRIPISFQQRVRIPRDREQGFHGMVNTDSTAT